MPSPPTGGSGERVGCRSSRPAPDSSPAPSSPSRGPPPPASVAEHVALLRWLLGCGIPAPVAAEAVEAELFGPSVDPDGRSLEERVMDRALAANAGNGGPAGDDGGFGGMARRRGGASDGQEVAGGRGGQVLRHPQDVPGHRDEFATSPAATDHANVAADGRVVVVHGGAHPSAAAGPASVEDARAPETAMPAESDGVHSPGRAVSDSADNDDGDSVVFVDESTHATASDTGIASGTDVGRSVRMSRVGTHQQTAEDLLRASFLRVTAGSAPLRVGGMALARQPIALPYPPCPESTSQTASEVYLVVDDRETAGSSTSRAAFLSRLRVNPGLAGRVITRRLPTGDATLVARVTRTGQAAFAGAPPTGTEVMLDQLVERKTADDLVASLRDGRLREQAYWMAASGRTSLTFVIEGSWHAVTRGDAAMRGDIGAFLARMTVEENIFVKETDNMAGTVEYYSALVRHRARRLGTADGLEGWLTRHRSSDGAVPGAEGVLTYSLWEENIRAMRGVATLQQLWSLQMSVLPGVGPVRIDVIMAAGYKTPAALAAAYGRLSEEDGRSLLAKLPPLPGGHHITNKVSEYVHGLFTAEQYGPRQ